MKGNAAGWIGGALCPGGGMADARALDALAGDSVQVRVLSRVRS